MWDEFEHRSDEELLERTAHEPEAFGAVYRRHIGAVLAFRRRRTGDPQLARDLLDAIGADRELRAGGLEVAACYQYSAQLTEPVVRAGAASLLASRCVFQLSEPEDAEEASKLAMSAYSSSVRPDPESRARTGITPDVIMHLPRHWAICSWQAGGARVPALAMNTLPLAVDAARVAHPAGAQRERGGFVPDVLPHPLAPAGDGLTSDPLPEPEVTRASAVDEDELAMLEGEGALT